jgi:hypothetical protein
MFPKRGNLVCEICLQRISGNPRMSFWNWKSGRENLPVTLPYLAPLHSWFLTFTSIRRLNSKSILLSKRKIVFLKKTLNPLYIMCWYVLQYIPVDHLQYRLFAEFVSWFPCNFGEQDLEPDFFHFSENFDPDSFWKLKSLSLFNISTTLWGEIFRIENPSVWQIPMFSQLFPMRNIGRLCAKRL